MSAEQSKIIIINGLRGSEASFENHLLEMERAPHTVDCYILAVRQYTAYSGKTEPDKPALLHWKQSLIQSKRPATVNLRIAGINAWCRYMGSALTLKPVRIQRRTSVENVISVDDYHKLIDGLKADGNYRWAAIYELLGQSGVRVSELINIRRSDLLKGFMEMFSKGKMRRVLFPGKLVAELLPIMTNTAPGGYVCINAHGQRLTDSGIRKMLRIHAAAYGIPPECAHPHAFRHMFAVEFLKRNKNIALLADLLGHSSVSTTGIYLQMSQTQQQAALDAAVTW